MPDHDKREATVCVLGADERTTAFIKADKLRLVVSNTKPTIDIDLLATEKNADGLASTFTRKNDGFGVKMEYKGTVTFSVDGKQYSRDFEEKP